MPCELLLTTRQTTKTRTAFANNMSTVMKLSKSQTPKIIQSVGSLSSWLVDLEKRARTNFTTPLARVKLPRLVSKCNKKNLKEK